MSVTLEVTIRGVQGNGASRLASALQDRSSLHAALAQGAESYIKERGAETAATEHATANRLGAKPTQHLAKAYQAIKSQSDASGARLLVPRASRLRAAFGAFTIRPTGGRKYLTIPAAAEAYGKRAGDIPDLVFMRIGPRKTPVLARTTGSDERMTVMYRLVKQINMKADPNLIPFEKLRINAADTAQEWADEIVRGGLA